MLLLHKTSGKYQVKLPKEVHLEISKLGNQKDQSCSIKDYNLKINFKQLKVRFRTNRLTYQYQAKKLLIRT